MTKQNYVLVDFENVQALDPEKLKDLPVKVVLFVGSHQKTVSMDILRKACALPGSFEVVDAVAAGKDALDFQIACFAGRLTEREPAAFIHFLSRDKGFDVVVQYLRSEGRLAARAEAFDALSFLTPKMSFRALLPEQRIAQVEAWLTKLPRASRPRKLKTLRSATHAFSRKELTESEVNEILEGLRRRGRFSLGPAESVSYAADAQDEIKPPADRPEGVGLS